MVSWKRQILDPASTTTEIFAGDVMNWIMQYHDDTDLGAGDPTGEAKISTATTYASGKLKLWDSNKSHKISFTTSDYLEEKEIKLPASLVALSDLVTTTTPQTLTMKQLDGTLNTLLNIPDSAFAQITNKAKLNSQIAYKDETGWLTDAMISAHTTTKITTISKSLLNSNILYKDVDNDLGDHFLEFGDITNPGNAPAGKMRLFYNQTTSAVSAIKPSGGVVNLEETVDITQAGFVPLTKGGLAQFTGNSSTTVFTIPHGLGSTPDLVTVDPASADAVGSYVVTKDATNITVTYQIPPPTTAASNVKLEWGAATAAHAASSFAAGGTISFNGTGAQTVFNIPHGLTGTTPETYFAEGKNAVSATDKYVSADNTNIIVTFITAPTTGTNNVVLAWGAGFVNEAWVGQKGGTLAAGGTATKSGDATTTVFTITHTLLTTPESYYVNATSVDARGSFILTADATNITITYAEPPPSGSNNLGYVWGASYVGGVAEETFTPSTADTLLNKTIDADLNTLTNIENADIKAAAGIVYSKLTLTGGIVNADINASAAIAYSKLNLATSIVNADVNSSAAIAYSKLNLANSILNADIAAHTSTKVTITAKGQLNSAIIYNDQSNTLADATNIAVGTTTGTKIGTATNQKIGFYNATPIVQGVSIADVNSSTVDTAYGQPEVDVITDLRTKVNSIISRLEALGLIATV